MLSPKYLEQLPTAMVQLFGQLEEDIIIDMARRIAKTGVLTDTAEYQAYRLQQLGAQRRYVMQRLSRITGKAQEELTALFADAARTTLAYDNELFEQAGYSPAPLEENAQLQQLVRAYRTQTAALFKNLTKTTARTASGQFERALDRAAMQMTSGAFSYQQAIRTAVKSLAAKGVETIVYKQNGKITQVTSTEVAVRRAVLTGVNQMASHVQLANAEQMGCDLVQVTAHGGARPEHAEWQGGVYSISGRHPKYKKLADATGYGTGEGLCGWNCRHNFFPFFEGLSEPANTAKELWEMEHATVTYNGEEIPLYEATQRQREIERNIRRWKREYLAMEAAGQDTTEAAVKLKKWRTIQADFCDQTGLRVDGFRGQVQGFGRSAASKASLVVRKVTQTPFTNNSNSSIIEKTTETAVRVGVNFVCKLDKSIYKVVSDSITSEEVIITDKQLEHIRERHPEISDAVKQCISDAILHPEYIIEDDRPNTANILKHFSINGKGYQVILRLKTIGDPEDYDNSIITMMSVNEKRWKQYLRNRNILYKHE